MPPLRFTSRSGRISAPGGALLVADPPGPLELEAVRADTNKMMMREYSARESSQPIRLTSLRHGSFMQQGKRRTDRENADLLSRSDPAAGKRWTVTAACR